jgi:uncharacterized protein YgiB involved in biofilm formation
MRRSRFVKLLSMGTAAIALTACEDPANTAVFETVQQCIDSGMYDSNTCRTQFDQAQKTHVAAAPVFTSAEECQAQFGPGKCETAPAAAQQSQASGSGSGSLFMPLMMGYMMGSMSRGGVGVPPQPLYRGWENGRSGAFRAANSTVVSNTTGRTAVNAAALRSPTLARGGFGSRAFAGS